MNRPVVDPRDLRMANSKGPQAMAASCLDMLHFAAWKWMIFLVSPIFYGHFDRQNDGKMVVLLYPSHILP